MNVTVTTRPVIVLMQQTMTTMVMMSSMAKVKKSTVLQPSSTDEAFLSH